MEPFDIDAVRYRFDPHWVRTEANRASSEIVTAGGDKARALERMARGKSRRRQALSDEDVGSVQADDERQRRPCHRCRDSSGNDPMSVHDRRALHESYAPGRTPSREKRERRGDVGRSPQAHVGSHRGRVSKHVERSNRRITIEVESDPLVFRRSRDERVPRRHHMNLVPARRNRSRDWFHEGADAVARESRIRRRYHHDDVSHGRQVPF
jgi:hypothetical protein